MNFHGRQKYFCRIRGWIKSPSSFKSHRAKKQINSSKPHLKPRISWHQPTNFITHKEIIFETIICYYTACSQTTCKEERGLNLFSNTALISEINKVFINNIKFIFSELPRPGEAHRAVTVCDCSKDLCGRQETRKEKKSRLYTHSFSLKPHDEKQSMSCLLRNNFLPRHFLKCWSFKSWRELLSWMHKALVWVIEERSTATLKSDQFIAVSPCSAPLHNCSTWQHNSRILLLFYSFYMP